MIMLHVSTPNPGEGRGREGGGGEVSFKIISCLLEYLFHYADAVTMVIESITH